MLASSVLSSSLMFDVAQPTKSQLLLEDPEWERQIFLICI